MRSPVITRSLGVVGVPHDEAGGGLGYNKDVFEEPTNVNSKRLILLMLSQTYLTKDRVAEVLF